MPLNLFQDNSQHPFVVTFHLDSIRFLYRLVFVDFEIWPGLVEREKSIDPGWYRNPNWCRILFIFGQVLSDDIIPTVTFTIIFQVNCLSILAIDPYGPLLVHACNDWLKSKQVSSSLHIWED